MCIRDSLKGNESTIVIIAIATTVPTAKKIKKIIPEKKFGVLGKIAIKTLRKVYKKIGFLPIQS